MPQFVTLYKTVVDESGLVVSSELVTVELWGSSEQVIVDTGKLQIVDASDDGLISPAEFNAATGGGGLGLNGGNQTVLFDGVNQTNAGTLYSEVEYNLGDDLNPLINSLVSNFPPVQLNFTPICVARGTLIMTEHGEVAVEDLSVGDKVCTSDGRVETIRWMAGKKVSRARLAANPKLRPIRISAGALGSGLPKRDLVVSRQHRMLVSSKIVMRMFGVKNVLISAIKLTDLPGIYVDEEIHEVEYFHLLFDKHEVIFAEGAPTESLFTGPEALKALPPDAKLEILTLFPQMAERDYTPEPAELMPTGRKQRDLISRHLKNAKVLIGG